MVAKVGHAVCLFRHIAFPVGPSRYNNTFHKITGF